MTSERHPFAAALLRGNATEPGGRSNSRAALLDAALEEFAVNGYEATTVAAIAHRAGVTTGAVYAHFSGKLELLLASIGLTPVEDIDRSADELGSLPKAAAASWLVRALGSAPDDRMVLLLDVIVAARREPRIARALRAGLESYVAATRRIVEAASSSGAAAPVVEAEDLSRLLALISLGRTVFTALDAPAPSARAFSVIGDALLSPSLDADEVDDSTTDAALGAVRARAAAVGRAEKALRDAIADAVDAGHSLRQVGAAAGMSHEGIRRILRPPAS